MDKVDKIGVSLFGVCAVAFAVIVSGVGKSPEVDQVTKSPGEIATEHVKSQCFMQLARTNANNPGVVVQGDTFGFYHLDDGVVEAWVTYDRHFFDDNSIFATRIIEDLVYICKVHVQDNIRLEFGNLVG